MAPPLALFALLPVLLAMLLSGPDASVYAAEVTVAQRLGATQQEKLDFLLVDLAGDRVPAGGPAPAPRFVITLDRGYTAGFPDEVRPGDSFAVEGSLMDPETYYGDQYLFFGYPQLYVSQVKAGVWWPPQVRSLRDLYAAPGFAVLSLCLVGALPFMEEYTLSAWLWTWARFAAVVAAIVTIAVWRKRMPRVALLVAWYLPAAVLLGIPGL